MRNQADLQASLDALAASIQRLADTVSSVPPPTDLTAQTATVDGMKTIVDAATATLTPAAAPSETPPAA